MTADLHPKATILIVEDNRIDAHLTRRALEKISNWPTVIHIVDDGDKALQYLRCESIYRNAPKPDLVILDMNLPKRDGTEVLQFIRAQEGLTDILVFIFSSSPVEIAQESTAKANLKADRYFEKPYEVGTYQSIAAEIKESYFSADRGRRSTHA